MKHRCSKCLGKRTVYSYNKGPITCDRCLGTGKDRSKTKNKGVLYR